MIKYLKNLLCPPVDGHEWYIKSMYQLKAVTDGISQFNDGIKDINDR